MKSRKLEKIFAVALAFTLLGTACTNGNSADGGKVKTSGNISKEYWVSQVPVEISIHHFRPPTPLKVDNPVMNRVSELTNVKLKPTVPQSASDEKQAFNIMIASGEYPDIISTAHDRIKVYSLKSVFVPLDDLIEQYAPHIKAFFEANPDVRKSVLSSDGKLYCIPEFMEGTVQEGYFIRKDWLEELHMDVPKTVDEYYNVLKAFKNNDMNGNGKMDEVPFFSRQNSPLLILSLFGGIAGWYIKDDKVYHGMYQTEYKAAIKNLVKWYSEGVIDKEIYTRGDKARDILLGDNLGGATHDWFVSTGTFTEKYKDKIPGFNFAVMAPPADINGKVSEPSSRDNLPDAGGWGISSMNKHPIETIKYFDFWFSDEGKMLYNYGIEGVHYNMVNGKPKYVDSILAQKGAFTEVLKDQGMRWGFGAYQYWDGEAQFLDATTLEGINMYVDNHYCKSRFPELTFTPEEQSIISEKMPSIQAYIKEMEQKWVLGSESVETGFDKYIENLKKMGMDQVIDIYNAAYQRYIK